MAASGHGNLDLVIEIVTTFRAKIDIKAQNGWSALDFAKYQSHSRYYVVCTSHTLEASRMTSEDKKGSTQAVQQLFGHAPFCFHPEKELFGKMCMPTFFSHT